MIEDTEATREDLLARFGRRITDLVMNEARTREEIFGGADLEDPQAGDDYFSGD